MRDVAVFNKYTWVTPGGWARTIAESISLLVQREGEAFIQILMHRETSFVLLILQNQSTHGLKYSLCFFFSWTQLLCSSLAADIGHAEQTAQPAVTDRSSTSGQTLA